MPLDMEVGLGTGDIVLHGDSAPLPKKGDTAAPNFWPMYCGHRAGWIKMPLGTEECLVPGHIVLGWNPAPPRERGTAPPNFWPLSIVAKRLDGSRCQLVRRMASPRPHCVTLGPSSSTPNKGSPPIFARCLLWPNGRPSQLLLSTCDPSNRLATIHQRYRQTDKHTGQTDNGLIA